jgi:hypothetical protein
MSRAVSENAAFNQGHAYANLQTFLEQITDLSVTAPNATRLKAWLQKTIQTEVAEGQEGCTPYDDLRGEIFKKIQTVQAAASGTELAEINTIRDLHTSFIAKELARRAADAAARTSTVMYASEGARSGNYWSNSLALARSRLSNATSELLGRTREVAAAIATDTVMWEDRTVWEDPVEKARREREQTKPN